MCTLKYAMVFMNDLVGRMFYNAKNYRQRVATIFGRIYSLIHSFILNIFTRMNLGMNFSFCVNGIICLLITFMKLLTKLLFTKCLHW